ncbi:WD40-repeat-containing domain protein [Ochromonadaceae sp. CCMP2298]|nr:WD40-repeat-containing domain protein [Ochromonadaceae sp. CCMP2298]
MSSIGIAVSTPEVLWHGGGNENGKPDPVYSVDFHPQEMVLLTSGIDANVPPKGSVRLWRIDEKNGQEFLLDLSDHQSAVNVARFSPDGKMLASASERQVVVYVVDDPSMWRNIADVAPLERIWLRPSLNEVFDLQWSPDSSYVIIGAIDNKAEIIRVSTRDSLLLPGHSSYIQGVAWDPRNGIVVTQSADRSVKAHKLKTKPNAMVKLAARGHCVMRTHTGFTPPESEAEKKRELTAADFGIDPASALTEAADAVAQSSTPSVPSISLFADSFVPSFFRRLCFTADGSLLLVPTGIHRPPVPKSSEGSADLASMEPAPASFCTHIFSRDNLGSPCLSLVGLDDPSIAVRCCPRPFKLIDHSSDGSTDVLTTIPGEYRFVFAVVTLSTVFVYDTQHTKPLAKFAGLHYAPINDVAWSEDGRTLVACSSDGYLSFFRFEDGCLGEFLEDAAIPESVKRAQPCLFKYTPPVEVVPTLDGSPEVAKVEGAASASAAGPDAIGAAVDSCATTSDAASCSAVTAGSATNEDDSAVAVPAVQVAESADAPAPDAGKKRKRIQPTMIGAIGSGGSPAVDSAVRPVEQTPTEKENAPVSANTASGSSVSGAAVVGSPALPAAESSGAGGDDGTRGDDSQRKKKRIAPVLIGPSGHASPAAGRAAI